MAGKGKSSDITSLPGVGAATEKKLKAAKLTTIAKIAKTSAKDLQKAGLSIAVAKKVLAAAKTASAAKSSAKKVGEKASAAAKKVANKTKSTAKKTSSATKKSASKTVAKGQEMAEKVVEKTKSTTTKLKTTKADNRKGSTINVPGSAKDFHWFKKP
jgi:DNA-binding protein HU-beta